MFVASKSGRHYTKNINRDYWNPACKKAGITIALNNAGRHSFANQLLEATDNISLVSKALGHSSIGITKKHYGDHSVDSMRRIIDNVRTNAFCSWGMRCGYVRVKWKRLILPKQRMFPINCSAISGK